MFCKEIYNTKKKKKKKVKLQGYRNSFTICIVRREERGERREGSRIEGGWHVFTRMVDGTEMITVTEERKTRPSSFNAFLILPQVRARFVLLT